ncbi:MAG: kelch repeat-containing protein, partial [Proteobacteria bacterium]|nr:kelch repeat-containing protein [Pseudomonadota bacterium]
VAEGRIYVIGGESLQSAHTFEQNEVLDPATGRWEPAADLPTPRHGVASATFGCRIAVIGGARASGRRSFGTLSQVIEVYEGACGKAI